MLMWCILTVSLVVYIAGILGAGSGVLTVLFGCYMAGILGARSGVLTVFLVVTWRLFLVLEVVYLQCCLVVLVSLVLKVVCILTVLSGCYVAGLSC